MLKNLLRKIFIISFELLLVSGLIWFIAEKKGIQSDQILPTIEQMALTDAQKIQEIKEPAFPVANQPVVKTFNWQYDGVKYTINETLDKAIYDYYNSQPKTFSYVGALPSNWEDNYYGMFLKQNAQDNVIPNLAQQLQDLGKKHNLSTDQIVDLTLAFVQSIPYDDARATEILSKTGDVKMQYPYETLYRQLGVCSDKSLLASAILRQMGYGVALFTYEQDNHMAIGIECPKNYSTYGSGYCYAETTAVGNKIGIIPSFDAASNKTVGIEQLALDLDQSQQTKLQQLGQVSIFQQTSGKEYDGIIQTNKIIQEINQLKNTITATLPQLHSQQTEIKKEESDLENMKQDLEKSKSSQSIDKYNSLVGKYNNLLGSYQKDVKNYNQSIGLYNQAIQRYNTLIKQ